MTTEQSGSDRSKVQLNLPDSASEVPLERTGVTVAVLHSGNRLLRNTVYVNSIWLNGGQIDPVPGYHNIALSCGALPGGAPCGRPVLPRHGAAVFEKGDVSNRGRPVPTPDE